MDSAFREEKNPPPTAPLPRRSEGIAHQFFGSRPGLASGEGNFSSLSGRRTAKEATGGALQRRTAREAAQLMGGGVLSRGVEAAPAPNRTGLPDSLKAGIESLSGLAMDDVQVHYNSAKPAQLQALAYTQGSQIHVAPGQERHLPHEAWHVVQQKQGRVRATTQMKGVGVNEEPTLEAEADVMGARAVQMKARPGQSHVQRQATSDSRVAQRVVANYKPGTLARNTLAMRNLSLDQMAEVQRLHDDPDNHYLIEYARAAATSFFTSSNPFTWEVNGIGNYAAPTDTAVQDILTNFGHPTQSVVKTYDDLASRVGYDVGKNRKGELTAATVSDLHQLFEASKPLHVAFNDFLNSAWTGNLNNYSGAKTGIPLYTVMRSETTKKFNGEFLGNVTLNDVLKEVSGRSPEVHHLLYKAHYPDLAVTPANLMLTERSQSEKVDGPGQHELMHQVASGKHSDKFKELLPQFVAEYNTWVQKQTGTKLV